MSKEREREAVLGFFTPEEELDFLIHSTGLERRISLRLTVHVLFIGTLCVCVYVYVGADCKRCAGVCRREIKLAVGRL